MSFEGYYQYLCPNGHYREVDVYDAKYCYGEDELWRCNECDEHHVWENLVDDTNCDNYGYVELEQDRGEVYDHCKCCGTKRLIEEATYKIPEDKGKRI